MPAKKSLADRIAQAEKEEKKVQTPSGSNREIKQNEAKERNRTLPTANELNNLDYTAKETVSFREPQKDTGFLRYSAENSGAKYEPTRTLSQMQYDVQHQQWLIDEAKKNGSNVTWNQALGRGANRAAQAAVTGLDNLGVSFGTTANQQGQAWAEKNGKASVPTETWADRAKAALQATETGRQNARIDALTARRNEYENRIKSYTASSLADKAMNSGGFASGSKYDPNLYNDKDFDLVYEQVNGTRRFQNWLLDPAAQSGGYIPNGEGGSHTRYNPEYSHLTPSQKSVFNYYYNQGDRKAALDYLDGIFGELEEKRYNADIGKAEKFASEHPVLASAVSPVGNFLGTLTAPAAIAQQAATGRIDPYSSLNAVTQTSQAMRNTVAENIAGSGVKGAAALSWLYQSGESILDNALRSTVLGGIGASVGQGLGLTAAGVKTVAANASLIPMALGVYQQTATDAKMKGRSDAEATAIGAIAAGAEYLTENISFDKLFDTYVNARQGARRGFRDWVSQMATEGMEEGASNIINSIADILILGDRSEWSESIRKYQASGMTEAEAKKQAFIDKAVEFASDVGGGVLSGGVMAGGTLAAAGIQASVNAAANSQTAKAAEEVKAKAEQIKGEVKAASAMTAEEWEASRKDQSDAAKKRRAAVRESGASLGVSEDMIRSVEAASDVTGQSVTFKSLDYDSLSDEQKKNISREDFGKISLNGYRNDTTGEIVLNSNAKTEEGIKFILGHELGHSIEGGKLWTQLRDLAYEYYARNGKDWNKEARDLLAELEFVGAENFDQDSEMTANFAGKFLLDNVESIEWLVNSNHSIATRVWNWINEKLATRFADDETATKAVLTRARELYGRALANNAKAGEGGARTLPTANAQAQQTQTQTAPAAVQQTQTQTTQTAESAEPTGEGALSAMPAPGMMPTAAQADASGEMSEYQQRAAELARERDSGEISQEGYEEALESLDNEYQRDPLAAYHEDMREAGLENERGERTYSVTEEDEKKVRDYVDSLPSNTRFSVSAPVEKVETEDGGELIAVHNLKKDSLDRTLELGAFPAPSIAVVLDSMGHDMYGDYSVLFGRDTIDPKKNAKNRLFGGDVWTPTQSNARVEYELDQDKKWKLDDKLGDLAKQVAGGIFSNSSTVASIESNNTISYTPAELAQKLAEKETVKAAYLASKGETLEPVFQEKQWNQKFGNKYLQMYLREANPQKLAQIYADLWEGKNAADALGDEYDRITRIIRQYYENIFSPKYRKVAEKKGWSQEDLEKKIKERVDDIIDKDVSIYTIEDFAKNAWEYYEDNGKTLGEIDRIATYDELDKRVNTEDVKAWIYDQIKGLYKNSGIYNGKDPFTPSGNRRTFKQTHWDVTAENIVKAMANAGESSVGAWGGGVLTESLPRYSSIEQMKADKGRLSMKEQSEYDKIIDDIQDRISDVAERIGKINGESGFIFTDAVSDIMSHAASGKRTTAAIAKAFAEEDLKINDRIANDIISIYNDAASVPTGYFEAKPMRVVGFDEVASIIAPDNADAEYLDSLRNRGFDVETYKAGDKEDRRRVVNDVADRENVKFSVTADINSPAFKEWFGDSKIVNEDGTPKVMYHGTKRGGFNVFGGRHDFWYFSDSKKYAMTFAGKKKNGQYYDSMREGIKSGAYTPKIYEAYLSVQNPFITEDKDIVEDALYWDDTLAETLRQKGYDALMLKDMSQVIVLNPEQIKSATDNIGTFDRNNPDIRYSVTEGLDTGSDSEYNTLASDPRVVWGSAGQTRTSGMEPVSFRYAVVPADTLIVSNDEYGNVNPDYPAELQPRDRSRATSQADIQRMANGIIPDVLADSPYVNNGAPVIRGDGVVVGGNGRAAALRLAESIGRKGEYDDYIRENAARFGIEGELPENPVLVRVADTDDWQGLARKSNESTNAAMSSTEQAESDAARLDSDILSLLDVGDDGDLNTAANRDFISEFVNNVAGESERGSLVDSDGYLSQEGLRRVQAAVFAKAYGDTGLLARMSESLDDDMKNVTKALMGAASRAAVVKNAISEGAAYDIDVTDEILAGIEIFEESKREKTDIDDIAGQMSLEGQKYGDAARAVALFANTNKRSGAKIRDFISAIYDEVLSLGDPGQISMDLFGGGTDNSNVTVNEVFRRAAGRLLEESGYDLTGRGNIDLGFEIEDIGERQTLPRDVRAGAEKSVNGDGDNPQGDVQRADKGRGRAKAQGSSGVILPTENSTPDSGRYIDRNSESFGDIIREEAAKLGMIEPAAGKQMGIGGDADRVLRNAQFSSKVSQRKADAEAREIKAEANAEGKEIIANSREVGKAYEAVGKEKGDRLVRNAQFSSAVMQRQAKAESKEIKAGAEAESKEILANAREAGKAYEALGKEKGERKGLHAQIVGEMRGREAIRKGEEKGAAKVESATEKANEIIANAKEVDQAYRAIEKDKEQARRDARKAAADRKANRDITVPASDDVNGQREMFKNLYQSQKKYKSATASKWMTASDMAKLRDLMAGTISAEYDLVGSDHPKMIREAFEALLEYDKAGRTVDAYGEQVRRELRETAAEKLKNSNSFKDKNYGFKYSRETERRNIRDIAPAEDAEAINQEYFYPVMKAARKKDSLLRKYNGRVKALGISQKVLKGNKVSEAYAVQLLGEIRAIKRELERATDTFMNKTAPGKIAKYGQTSTELDTSGSDLDAVLDEMGVPDPRKEKGQKGAKKGRIAGLSTDEQNAMESMSQGEFSDYIMSKAPKKYGMTLAEYEALEQKFIKENPNLDYAAVDRKIDGMRGIYDELESQLNETYMRWGYPPLGHIEGYFPHFINDSGNVLQKMGKRLGLSSASLQLPTEIVGQTAERKPGVKWFANKLTRNTNVTDYDAIEGYARYIEGATDVIAFTESIQKLRAYVNEIRYKNSDKAVQEEVNAIMRDKTKSLSEKYFDIEQRFADLGTDKYALNNYVQNVTEYINNLAGKKSLLDRGMEWQVGRNKLYRALNAYNRLRAMSAVSMNITSALTNIIPIAQVTGVAGVGNTMKAFGDTIVNMFSKGDGLREMSDFLMTREGVTPVNQTGFEKAIDAAGILFKLLDRLGAETVWRANYYNNKKAGLSTEAAAAKADIEADETISGRYKGARPTLFNSQNPIVQMGTRFVQEANNFISYALKDVPRERRERGKNVLLGEAVMFFFLWLYNEGFQALFGRRPAQEPSELVNDIAADITGYRMPNVFRLGGTLINEKRLPTAEDFKTEKGDLVTDVTLDAVDILPFSGWAKLLSDAAGYDLDIQGGRFEVGDSLPDIGRLKTAGDQWQVWAEELSKPVTSLIPGGNQIQKTVKGVSTMIAGGSYKINDKGERQLQYPAERSAGNWARAIIAGKSSLPTAQEWVEKGFDTLSVKDTEIYDMLTGYDVKPEDALGLIKSLNAIQKTDEESRSKLQRKALIDSGIDQTAKLMLYYGKFAGDKEKALIDEIGGSSGDALLKAIDGCKNSSTQGGDIKAIIGSPLSGSDKVTMYDDYVLDKDSRERAAIEAVRNGEDGNALMKLIDGVKSAVKTDEESAAKQKRDLLVGSSLSGESKLTLYTDSGLFGASEKEIEILKSLSGSADNDELTKAAARLKLSAKGYDDTLALMEASLPRDAKKELYLGLCVDADGREKKASQISDVTGAGLNFDDYLKIANKYYELNDNKDIKAGAKATEFSYWLDGQKYTDRQKAAAQEAFGYYSQVRAKPSGYEKMTDTGLSADMAYEINRQMSALEPKPGKSQVSDTQKAQVIVSQQGLTDEEKLSALRGVYSEDSNTNYSKAYVAVSYGVPLETYYKVIDRCLEVDDDPQYASYKPQERARAVIDSFGELTNRQKAAIWQCYTVNWSAKSNPFDQSVGAYVHSLYYESDGKTRKDIMPGNLPRQASSSGEAAAPSSSGGSSSRTAAEALTSGTMPTASQISGSGGRSAGSALAGALSGRR